ncbi:Integrin alpha-3 [Trichoplax sp. H2]|nr:Integrin alpha-3 [Trichoplax sp. H2]|eukprot:RDD42681.1 Integrin alpha-3 [Trichoplax sp. H2]
MASMVENGTHFGKISFLVLYLLLNLAIVSFSYNLEQSSPIVKKQSNTDGSSSLFGFALTLHQQDASTFWVLVGAPEYKINNLQSGAVFKCPITNRQNASDCHRIDIDDNFATGDMQSYFSHHFAASERQPKFGQWLGASVATGGPGKRAIVCAPRFQNIFFENGNYQYRLKGKCKILNNTLERFYGRESYDPFIFSGSIKGGNVQLGWASSFTTNYLPIIGAPGASYASNANNFEGTVAEVTEFNPSTSSGTYKLAIYDTNNNAIKNNPDLVSSEYDDTLVGYSITSGRFLSQNEQIIAAGAPRANIIGQVKFYKQNSGALELISNLTLSGNQIGERYGTSLAAVDLNNDGFDDLVIGSPYYSRVKEEGRIYIYFNTGKGGFVERGFRIGRVTNGAFGLTVTSIGDIDQDGFNDVAIGAPFDGNNKTGVVYIYRGDGNLGLKRSFSQAIDAASFANMKLNGFGIAVSGKIDVDKNGYPDVAVGSYESDTVLVFRARPKLSINTTFIVSQQIIKRNESKSCVYQGNKHACVNATLCFSYRSKSIQSSWNLNVELEADANTIPSRVFFENGQNKIKKTVAILTTQSCNQYTLFLKNEINNFISDISVTYRYSLSEDARPTNSPSGELFQVNAFPIISADVPTTGSRIISYEKSCFNSSICIPDLHLNASIIWNGNYPAISVGVTNVVNINFNVNNTGDDAFNAKLYVHLPAGVEYLQTQSDTVCNQNVNSRLLDCPVGNPLTKVQRAIKLRLAFDVRRIALNITRLRFLVNVTSLGNEKPSALIDNQLLLNINITYNATLVMSGISRPDVVTFGNEIYGESAVKQDSDIGSLVIHDLYMRNIGPGVYPPVRIEISWPSYAPSGKHLLYLISLNMSSNAKCSVKSGILNSLNVPVTQRTNVSARFGSRLTRRKRDYDTPVPTTSYTGSDLKCGNVICDTFTCDIDYLASQQSASISVISRLWSATLASDYGTQNVRASSSIKLIFALVTNQITQSNSNTVSVTTTITSSITTTPQPVPSYIYVLSIVGGLIFLAIIVFILYILGFFKRKQLPKISAPQQRRPEFRPSES